MMAVTEPLEPSINYPEWTDYSKKNGLDPLGMQNSSVNLYQTFLPGISNVTLRMRPEGTAVALPRQSQKSVSFRIRVEFMGGTGGSLLTRTTRLWQVSPMYEHDPYRMRDRPYTSDVNF